MLNRDGCRRGVAARRRTLSQRLVMNHRLRRSRRRLTAPNSIALKQLRLNPLMYLFVLNWLQNIAETYGLIVNRY